MSKPTRLFKGIAAAMTLMAVSSASMAASSAISSVVQDGSRLVVKGSNFGVKSTPAPTFFQPFTGLANGATPKQAGFDSWINRGGEAVTLADGVGGGSLRCDPEKASNAFPHIGKYLPSGTQEMRVSFYFKLYGSSTKMRQLKFVRAGVRSGGDGAADYSSSDAKIYGSLWIDKSNVLGANSWLAEWRTANNVVTTRYPDETGAGGTGLPLSSQPTTKTSDWVFAEVYYKFNDVGVANGVFRGALNGYTWHDRTALQIRTSASQSLTFVQPIPSMDLDGDTREYDYALSRVYIDVGPQSKAQVYLSDSATAAKVTKKFLLPPTAWTNDSITVTDAAQIPSGYKYVYVTNVNGETNANGFPLGSAVSPPVAPVLNAVPGQ